ncbi:hypothetical protein GJAV_G00048740 [Gymnothorax javanicus]|nr:hypothetical protein GJAV_G00048740 [Gymnothorax javanicus]
MDVFLCIPQHPDCSCIFPAKSDYSAGPQIPVYALGSVVLSIINAVTLATEVFLKAEKGERTVEDLQLIVLPFESFFLACWFGSQLFLYCMQEKEIIKDQLRLIDHCCKKGQSPTSSQQNQEAAEMESLSERVQSPTQRQEREETVARLRCKRPVVVSMSSLKSLYPYLPP